MMHIIITSFHINLHANKSYLLDVDPQCRDSIDTRKFKILENTLSMSNCIGEFTQTHVI